MRKRQGMLSWILLGMIVAFMMAACEKPGNESKMEKQGFESQDGEYVCERFEKIWSGEEGRNRQVLACFDHVIYSSESHYWYQEREILEEEIGELVEEYDAFQVRTTIYGLAIDEAENAGEQVLCELEGFIECATAGEDGALFLVLTSSKTFLGLEEERILACLGTDGREIFQRELERGPQVQSLSAGGGKIWAKSLNQILVFDAKGKKKDIITLSSSGYLVDLCADGDECFVICLEKGPITKRVGKKKETVVDQDLGFLELSSGSAGGILARNSDKIYLYESKTGSWQELLRILDIGVSSKDILTWWMDERDRISFLIREGNDTCLVTAGRHPMDELSVKKTLTIGTWQTTEELQRLIAGYQRMRGDIRIEIQRYGDGVSAYSSREDMENALQRLRLDLTAGKGPDLLCVDVLRLTDLAPNALLEDLGPWLDRSKVIRRDDFFPAVLQSATYDGKLTYLTDSFTLSTLMGRASLLGKEKDWTLERILSLAKSHPNSDLFQRIEGGGDYGRDANVRNYLENLLILSGERIFGKKGEKADMETLCLLLQLAKEQYDGTSPLAENIGERVGKGGILLYEANLYDFYEICHVTTQIFGGKEVRVAGYPAEGGEGKSILFPKPGIGILQTSEEKEEAFAFLEYYLTSSDQESLDFFSSRKSVFEGQLAKARQLAKELQKTEKQSSNMAKSEEGDGEVWNLEALELLEQAVLESAGTDAMMEEQILDIIFEEANAFFAGGKSAEAVGEIIWNRVRLYLGESVF